MHLQAMTAKRTRRAWAGAITGIVAGVLAACGDEADPIIGSGNVVDRVSPVMIVEKLRIVLPFDTLVVRGEAGRITVRADDNLLDYIDIRERSVSDWEIVAPMDLVFEQSHEVQIEVPFVDMVKVACTENIRFEADPAELLLEKWR